MKTKHIALSLGILVFSLCTVNACGGESAAINSEISSEINSEIQSGSVNSTENTSAESAQSKYSQIELIEPDGSFSEKVTMLVYVTGSDLESKTGAATNDMEEIQISGVDLSQVNVLVYTGGSEQWHNNVSADTNTVFKLTDSGYEAVTSYDSMSMGDPGNLSRFLNYAYENYPADTFDLILWDHGNGPVIGYGLDKQYNNDSLTLLELSQALADSPFNSTNKLGFIGFDACLMASAELACTVEPYADYLISSQETEPGFGWDYSFLNYCGKLPAKDLAQNIVSLYLDYCDIYYASKDMYDSDVTLSVTDLQYAKQLQDSINGLFALAADDVSGYYSKLAFSRVQSRALGRASTGSEYDLVDLKSLMANMEERYPDEAKAIGELIDKSIIVNGYNTTGCSGMSIYYPFYNKTYYEKSWKATYDELNIFPNYSTFLQRYSQIWLGTEMTDYFEGTLTATDEGNSLYSMTMPEELAENFAGAQYTVLRKSGDEVYQMVYTSADCTIADRTISANFNGKVIYMEDRAGTKFIPITMNIDNHDTFSSYEILLTLNKNGESVSDSTLSNAELMLEINSQDDSISIKGLYEMEDDSDLEFGKRPEVDLSLWDNLYFPEVQHRYITRNENGTLADYWSWPEDGSFLARSVSSQSSFNFYYEPLYDDGDEYFIMFRILDSYGNINCSELLPIILADAPQDNVKTSSASWTDNSVVLADSEKANVSLTYAENRSKYDNDFYIITELKSTKDKLSVNVADIVINNKYYFPTASVKAVSEVEQGQKLYLKIENLAEYLNLLPEKLDRLTFTLSVHGYDGFLIDPIEIEIGNMDLTHQPAIICDSMMGAMAEKQTILSNDDFSIDLNYLGFTAGSENTSTSEYSKLSYELSVENRKQDSSFSVLATVINGCVIDTDVYGVSQILPGKKAVQYASISQTNLAKYQISSIYDISVLVDLDGKIEKIPVTLSSSGDYYEYSYEGTMIYEDDTVQIYCRNVEEKESYDGKPESIYDIYVVNNTEKNYRVDFDFASAAGGGADVFSAVNNPTVAADSIINITLYKTGSPAENNIIIMKDSLVPGSGYASGPITLPTK